MVLHDDVCNQVDMNGYVSIWGQYHVQQVFSLWYVEFFNWPNPSSHTVTLGSTQPLAEMSTRNLPGGKGWPVHKADSLTTICEPIV
jgi:hypothetical protein